MNNKDFKEIPNHTDFVAKRIFGAIEGQIKDGAIAHISLNGGGPTEQHSHLHNHLFIVTKGEAVVKFGDDEVVIHENESYLVEGARPHSVWNNGTEECVMIGITIDSKI